MQKIIYPLLFLVIEIALISCNSSPQYSCGINTSELTPDEEAIKKYLLQNTRLLDPIEGIYSVEYTIVFADKDYKIRSHETTIHTYYIYKIATDPNIKQQSYEIVMFNNNKCYPEYFFLTKDEHSVLYNFNVKDFNIRNMGYFNLEKLLITRPNYIKLSKDYEFNCTYAWRPDNINPLITSMDFKRIFP